ncbi:MAG: SAF domain-containing protein [Mycobacteriaceae bacterium]
MSKTRRRIGALGVPLRTRIAALARPGWARTVHARRGLAAALVVLAAVLAVRGDPARRSVAVVVAAHDLSPGHVLTSDDLRSVALPAGVVPGGAVREATRVTGRTVAGGVRGGEPMTDVRVLGPALANLATHRPDATSVPVRLSDPDVADLLRSGDEVTVLVLGGESGSVRVLTRAAVVLAVPPAPARGNGKGRLVVLGVGLDDAAAVAAASLQGQVTVTFR